MIRLPSSPSLCRGVQPRCWPWTPVVRYQRGTQVGLAIGRNACLFVSIDRPACRVGSTRTQSSHPLINIRALRSGDVLLANGAAIGLGAVLYIGLSAGSLVALAPEATGYGLALPVFWAGFVMLPFQWEVSSPTALFIVLLAEQALRHCYPWGGTHCCGLYLAVADTRPAVGDSARHAGIWLMGRSKLCGHASPGCSERCR